MATAQTWTHQQAQTTSHRWYSIKPTFCTIYQILGIGINETQNHIPVAAGK